MLFYLLFCAVLMKNYLQCAQNDLDEEEKMSSPKTPTIMPSEFRKFSNLRDFDNTDKSHKTIKSRPRKLAFDENEDKTPKQQTSIRIQSKAIKKEKHHK